MAVLDFGKNRLTLTVSGTTASNHAPVAGGLFRRQRGSYVSNPKAYWPREFAYGDFTITLSGVVQKASDARQSDLNYGMFGAGRLTVSNYVYVSNFTPKVIFVM